MSKPTPRRSTLRARWFCVESRWCMWLGDGTLSSCQVQSGAAWAVRDAGGQLFLHPISSDNKDERDPFGPGCGEGDTPAACPRHGPLPKRDKRRAAWSTRCRRSALLCSALLCSALLNNNKASLITASTTTLARRRPIRSRPTAEFQATTTYGDTVRQTFPSIPYARQDPIATVAAGGDKFGIRTPITQTASARTTRAAGRCQRDQKAFSAGKESIRFVYCNVRLTASKRKVFDINGQRPLYLCHLPIAFAPIFGADLNGSRGRLSGTEVTDFIHGSLQTIRALPLRSRLRCYSR
ncbi:hypothetical protein IWX90DRAFT_503174 [Phyllosticta citrichinensis]|uniref:Uncharacterized protein n=1 Tax=Phyllosticta citrichinensis TaxID=1130410 RepID=A0ABR1XTC7_9PEZI